MLRVQIQTLRATETLLREEQTKSRFQVHSSFASQFTSLPPSLLPSHSLLPSLPPSLSLSRSVLLLSLNLPLRPVRPSPVLLSPFSSTDNLMI